VPRLLAILCALALGLAASACGGDEEKQPGGKGGKAGARSTATGGKAGTTATTATTAAAPECRRVPEPKPKPAQKVPRPTQTLDAKRAHRAVVATSCGEFTITLDVRRAPKTASSFAHLARRGFYDELLFHRVIPEFVIQGGDPLGNGQGGPGYKVVEPPPDGIRYTRGVVAMAKTEIEESGTSGSQFYVVTGEDAQLPPEYALVGRVTAGQEVVDTIGIVPIDQSDPEAADRPLEPVVIRRVTIESGR